MTAGFAQVRIHSRIHLDQNSQPGSLRVELTAGFTQGRIHSRIYIRNITGFTAKFTAGIS